MKKVLAALGAIVAIVVLLSAMGAGKLVGRSAVDTYYDGKNEDTLSQVATEVNKSLPKMVDSETRLDRTLAGPGKLFTYQNTLINRPAPGENPFDILDNVDDFSSNLTNTVCNNLQMRPMLSMGVTVVYHYNDKSGNKLFDVVINSGKCSF